MRWVAHEAIRASSSSSRYNMKSSTLPALPAHFLPLNNFYQANPLIARCAPQPGERAIGRVWDGQPLERF